MTNNHANSLDTLLAHISNSENINKTNEQGLTLLMLATQHMNESAIRLLLAKGADTNARNNEGVTALMIASKNNDHVTAKILLENNADPILNLIMVRQH